VVSLTFLEEIVGIEVSSSSTPPQKNSYALGAEVGSNNLYDTFDQAAMDTAGSLVTSLCDSITRGCHTGLATSATERR
jgi:hypothetical protein